MTVTTRVSKGSPLTNTEMDSNLNSLNWRSGATIASASNITLAEEYNSFAISGSATITGITKTSAATGFVVRFYFLGSCTLTQNLASFQLPGEANITTQVADRATFIHVGNQNWRCIDYTPNDISPHPLDEDDMSSNSATHVATQQSIKTYVDNRLYAFKIANTGNATNLPSGWSVAAENPGTDEGYNTVITHSLGHTNYYVIATASATTTPHFCTYSDVGSNSVTVRVWKYDATQDPQSHYIAIIDVSTR